MTFRAGVGAVVIDADGRVLACERADVPGAWQLPQGGLDAGEEPRDAVLRELEEETSLRPSALSILDEHPEWLAYEHPPEHRRPTHGRGQVQKWFLLRFDGADGDIDVEHAATPEFRACRWMRLTELADETISYRQPVYRKLAERFADHLR